MHLIRRSLGYASYNDRKEMAAALRGIYTACDVDAAYAALADFSGTPLGKKYPAAVAVWERAWDRFTPFLAFPPELRKIIYTTNAIESFKPSFERLDVLVLAQGAVIYRRGEFAMDGFRKVIEINLMSLMACATKLHPMLSAAKGSLIIVSSTAAYHSTKGNPAYNASKTGAVGLTRTLAQAWAEDGIRVNGIAPGLVDTKMTKVTTSNPKRLEGSSGSR